MDRWIDILTLQVFLLGGCLLVCGGFTHGSTHLGSRQGVLRRGDAVRERLTRHLPSAESNLDKRASDMVLQRTATPPPPDVEMNDQPFRGPRHAGAEEAVVKVV